MNKYSIKHEKNMTRNWIAPKEVQIEQLRKNIEKGMTYRFLCRTLDVLFENECITNSERNKYKRWYRRIKRGEV